MVKTASDILSPCSQLRDRLVTHRSFFYGGQILHWSKRCGDCIVHHEIPRGAVFAQYDLLVHQAVHGAAGLHSESIVKHRLRLVVDPISY
jgi:hypothetical protein